MAPSLFSNQHSRGPLYQYWRERNLEEKALRDQRIADAKERATGQSPTSAAYGPSSTEQYMVRAMSGPPNYGGPVESDGDAAAAGYYAPEANASDSAALPSYGEATGAPDSAPGTSSSISGLSAEEEKGRLRRRYKREDDETDQGNGITSRPTRDDHQDTLSGDEAMGPENDLGNGKGKEPARRKSTGAKIGRWIADAASGYTKNQGRW